VKPSNSGVIEALEDNLIDLRNPLRIRHSLASQQRFTLHLAVQHA